MHQRLLPTARRTDGDLGIKYVFTASLLMFLVWDQHVVKTDHMVITFSGIYCCRGAKEDLDQTILFPKFKILMIPGYHGGFWSQI